MRPLRVGFVGLGGICRQRHVPGLRRIPDVEIVAVANRSRASSERSAEELGIPEVCDSWEALIGRPDVDAVFIGTWPYLHRAVSVAALEAGKHVFCQARMAMDLAEGREMLDCARKSGRVAMLCPVPFGLSVDPTICRWLREGRLGAVHLVRVQSFSNTYIDPAAPVNWRKDHRLSGLNTLTLGMYIEVIHRWFGPTRAVWAQTQIFTPERLDAEGKSVRIQIPDQVLFTAEMQAGFPVQYAFSGVVRNGVDVIEVYGTKATLRYDVAQDVLCEMGSDGSLLPVSIQPEDTYDVRTWRVEEDFVNAIRLGSEYHPDFEDGVRYMQVIQGVHDSAARGCLTEIASL